MYSSRFPSQGSASDRASERGERAREALGSPIESHELQSWLEWASAKLIALPGARIGPRDSGVLWPDYPQDTFQVLDFRRALSIRAMAPTPAEMALMDEILFLPNLISHEGRRRVVRYRSLVHPTNMRHLFRWNRIAELLSIKIYTARDWHRKGLAEIIGHMSSDKIHTIRQNRRS